MLPLRTLCFVWFLQTFLICCHENSTDVSLLSVPERHHVCLRCRSSHPSPVTWTRQDRRVLDKQDRRRFLQRPDGGLCVQQLEPADQGEYRCNQLLVAELQVLTGQDFLVSAGRTLLLPCSRSPRPRQRWFHRRSGGRRAAILTRFRNGTVKLERGGGRLSFKDDALQIQDLQPEDTGEYQCNEQLQGRVTVLSVSPEPTSIQTSSCAAATSVVDTEVEVKKKRSENALLSVAVSALGSMIVLLSTVCLLLIRLKCRKKKRHAAAQRHEDVELQPWTSSLTPDGRSSEWSSAQSPSGDKDHTQPPEDTVHYASLGHQDRRDRPCRTPPDPDQHRVIYSAVLTGPAVQ